MNFNVRTQIMIEKQFSDPAFTFLAIAMPQELGLRIKHISFRNLLSRWAFLSLGQPALSLPGAF